MRKHLTRAVLHAIAKARRQTSARQLAKEAGVSNQLLSQLQAGDFQATPDVAERLAAVFEQWGQDYQQLARTIRAAARHVPNLRTRRKR